MIAYFETVDTGKKRGLFWKKHLETQLLPVGRASFLIACLAVPQGMGKRKVEKQVEWAMGQLKKRGVHRLAIEEQWRRKALEMGMLTVEEGTAWRQGAGQGALWVLRSRGIPLEQAFCRLEAQRCDRDVVRCARILGGKVRYLSVSIKVGQQKLEEALYEQFGIAPQQSAPPEYPCLRIRFPQPGERAERGEDLLMLSDGGWPGMEFAPPQWAMEQKPPRMGDTLYAAMLLESGLCRPEDLGVKGKETKGEEGEKQDDFSQPGENHA